MSMRGRARTFSFAGLPAKTAPGDQARTLSVLTPHLSQALLSFHRFAVPATAPENPHSTSERELLRLLASGRSNPEIAKIRNRSVATVRNQIHGVFVKLGGDEPCSSASLGACLPRVTSTRSVKPSARPDRSTARRRGLAVEHTTDAVIGNALLQRWIRCSIARPFRPLVE